MKKIVLNILLLTILGIFSAKAQVSTSKNQTGLTKGYDYKMSHIIPNTPQASIFQKYINHEITEYSGIPKIEIPLYEIKLKEGSIPITLSYHASGIKYRQDDGEVGVGWSINTDGYRIMKTIKGRDDFKGFDRYEEKYHYDKLYEIMENKFPKYYLNEYYASYSYESRERDGYFYYEYNVHDGEKDLYTYILPTYSGKYVVPGINPGKPQSFLVKNNNIKVNFKSQQEWNITDHNGNIFDFGSIDESAREIYQDPKYLTLGPQVHGATNYTQSWLLTKMKTPFNETIDFSYMGKEKKNYNASPGLSIFDAPILHEYAVIDFESQGSGIRTIEAKSAESHYVTKNKYIDIIKTNHEIIIFNRGVEINGHLIDHLLESIEIKDYNSSIIKKISFKYIYTSPNKKRHPYSDDMHLRAPYHILLSGISIGDSSSAIENYKLDYYMPENMQKAEADQWGYYTEVYPSQYDEQDGGIKEKIKYRGYLLSPVDNRLVDETKSLKYSSVKWTKKNLEGWAHQVIYSNPVVSKHIIPLSADIPSNEAYNTQDRFINEDYIKSFTLKKITNPLGGYTEYEYESNKYQPLKFGNSYKNGAGLRIKKIVSKSNSDMPSVITHFEYGKGTTKGNLEYFNILRFYSGFHFSLGYKGRDHDNFQYPMSDDLNFENMRISRTLLSRPNVEMFDEASQVVYSEVSIIQEDEKGNAIGKITSKYDNLQNIEYGTYMFNQNPGIYNILKEEAQKELKTLPQDFDGHLYLRDFKIFSEPRLISKVYYNHQGTAIRMEEYEYSDYPEEENKIEGFKTKQLLTTADYSSMLIRIANDDVKLRAIDLFEVGYPQISTSYSLLKKKTISEIFDTKLEFKAEEYYDYDNWRQLTFIGQSTSKFYSQKNFFKYSYDYSDALSKEMVSKNMLSPVLEKVISVNDKETSRLKTSYFNDSTKTKGLILPQKVETSTTGTSGLKAEVNYDRYDNLGNLLQKTSKDGVTTSYIWSYNGQYPVAEVINASYEQMEEILGAEAIGSISGSLSPDMTKINSLREKLPAAQVTTYQYKPLVGMIEKTDPRGVTTYYDYDSFGRLKESYIKENGLKRIIESYNYHSYSDSNNNVPAPNCKDELDKRLAEIEAKHKIDQKNCGYDENDLKGIPSQQVQECLRRIEENYKRDKDYAQSNYNNCIKK